MGGKAGGTKYPVADYLMSIHFGICKGPLDHINQVYVKELPIWCGQVSEYQSIPINRPELFGGDKKEGGVKGVIECYFGTADQIMTVASAARYGKAPEGMPGYRGIGNIMFHGTGTGGFKWISNNPYIPGTWVNVTRIPKGLSSEFAWIYSADPDYLAESVVGPVPIESTAGGTYYRLSTLGISDADVDAGLVILKMSLSASFVGVGLGEGLAVTGYVGVEYYGYRHDAGETGPGTLVSGAHASDGAVYGPDGSAFFQATLTPGVRWIRVNPRIALTYPLFSEFSVGENKTTLSKVVYGPSYCEIKDHLGVLPDANPAHMVYEALTDRDWGMGASRESIDVASFMYAAETFYNEKFGLSMIWTQQAEINSYISEILDHVQAALFLDPRSGLWTLVPFRLDYDVADLMVLDPSNCRADNRQRKALGETINEIVVTWTNPNNEKEETITYQDLGNISAQGGVVSDTRSYYGIRNAALANFVGARDIRAAAYPLFGCDIVASRKGSSLRPGSAVKFNWPEDGIENMILRVTKVDYGKPGDSSIKLSVIEDIFGLEQTVYSEAQESLWEDPDVLPTPMTATEIITSPLPLLLRSGMALSELSDDDYPIVSVGVFSDRASGDVENFDLMGPAFKPTGETYTGVLGTLSPTPYGVLTSRWPANASSSITDDQLFAISGFETPETGDFIHVEGLDGDRSSEIIMLDTHVAGIWTLARGMFDTIPRAWPIGTRAWFIGDSIHPQDPSEKNSGVSIPYQLLPKSSGGRLALGLAPVINFTPSDRPYCPFRPANLSMVGVGGAEPTVPYPTTLQNGGAEVPGMAGWSAVSNFLQVPGVGFTPPLLPRTGTAFFWTDINTASAQMEQRLSVPPGLWSRVDVGNEELTVNWYQAGSDTVTDPCRVELVFEDKLGNVLTTVIGPNQYSGSQLWLRRNQIGTIPPLCRSVVIRFVATRIGDALLGLALDDITCTFEQGAFQSLLYVNAGIPTSLTLGWSNRNRLSEDVIAPRWKEGTITPETGQTTTIRVKDRFSGAVEMTVSGLFGMSYSLALSGLTAYRFYDIEVASVRNGFESIQSGKLELELIRLGYGNNYGYDYGENDGD